MYDGWILSRAFQRFLLLSQSPTLAHTQTPIARRCPYHQVQRFAQRHSRHVDRRRWGLKHQAWNQWLPALNNCHSYTSKTLILQHSTKMTQPCLSILSAHHCISGHTILLFVWHLWQLRYLAHLSEHVTLCVCVCVHVWRQQSPCVIYYL